MGIEPTFKLHAQNTLKGRKVKARQCPSHTATLPAVATVAVHLFQYFCRKISNTLIREGCPSQMVFTIVL